MYEESNQSNKKVVNKLKDILTSTFRTMIHSEHDNISGESPPVSSSELIAKKEKVNDEASQYFKASNIDDVISTSPELDTIYQSPVSDTPELRPPPEPEPYPAPNLSSNNRPKPEKLTFDIKSYCDFYSENISNENKKH